MRDAGATISSPEIAAIGKRVTRRLLAGVPAAWDMRGFLPVAAICALFALAYYKTIYGLFVEWWTYSSSAHGFLILPCAVYLLWTKRADLLRCRKRPSWVGLVPLVFGLVMFVAGVAGNEEFIEQASLPLTLFGLLYFLGGTKVASLSWFPLLYLYLMIPIPIPIYKAISLQLRLLDARVATAFCLWLDVPIFRDGYFLYLPNVNLEVADACSGVFSIVALVGIGILYVRQQPPGWRRLVLSLLLVPTSIFVNIARIVFIILLCYASQTWVLHSMFHTLTGTVNFVLGLGMLTGLGTVLRWIPPGRVAQ
jgi:exosortase